MDIKENDSVTGIDMRGNPIQGTVLNILRTFQVAVIKTGADRLNITEAYVSDLVKEGDAVNE